MYSSPIGSGGEHVLSHKEGDQTDQSYGNRNYGGNQEWGSSGVGSAGSADFYNQGQNLPKQPLYRNPQSGPRIGSAGETTPNYSSDPSIGTAGEIPAQPFDSRDRHFQNAPPIGSGSAMPQQGWNPQVGTGNEGEHQEKKGILHKILHPFSG